CTRPNLEWLSFDSW
nr:immunoglobulin heavy chain junction region [Macaca mulatta]MOX00341.1 immunoglobulin heavy chain junction region [Macaca mulatta]MOX02924.1 immunoglobulin heavy chain junction region [Macaca mulatta]MOX03661.1 immunoglobulin heavy chain junction region [Macaca mulatta]MOX03994.1 immunoglobulin heavy chain junction region [Macaca mulatta]